MKFNYINIKNWLKKRKPVFIIDIIVVLVGLLFWLINQDSCMKLFYTHVVFFALIVLAGLHIYPQILNGILAVHCNQKVANSVAPVNADIVKIKEEIKNESIQKRKNKPDVKSFIDKETSDDIKNLINDLKDKKYKKIVLRARQRINRGGDTRYNIILELAYSGQDVSEYNIQDRISNLFTIIKQNIPVAVKITFIISYINCNLFNENYSLVERAIYKAIGLVLKSELDPKYLAILYKMQMDNFVMQNRISEAIASGNKALKYADEKECCRIHLGLSKIYFYFLDDNKSSLDNASLAWEHIYKDAPFIKELVQLCYITLFIDNRIDTACEFLQNFTANEKDDSYKDNLSYLLYKNGNKKNALNNANYCIKQNKKEAIASINTLAMIEKDEGRFEEAIYHFSEVIPELEPNKQLKIMKYFWLEALYNRSVCYIKLGNFEKAKTDMEIVIKENYTGIDAEILKEYYDINPEHIVD